MTDNVIYCENDGVENMIQSQMAHEKENKVQRSTQIDSLGKSRRENPNNVPSNLTPILYTNNNANDFGPLSPVQINASSNTGNSKSAIRSRQQKRKKSAGAGQQESMLEESVPDEKYVYEEGVSLLSELAIFANAEEEKQLKRIMTNDYNKNAKNKAILRRSQKLVGFLGGSIRAALQQKVDEEPAPNRKSSHVRGTVPAEALSEDPGIQRLNDFVGDFIGKLGSLNQQPANGESRNDEIEQVKELVEASIETNNEKSPILQPKSKYWETLMLRSEEQKNMNDEFCDSRDPLSLEITTPCVEKKTSSENESLNKSSEETDNETEPSPQSMISIPMDYSPGDAVLDNESPPRKDDVRSREENSPGSLMYNMISAATEIETPLVYKIRPSTPGKSISLASVPDVANFGTKISYAKTSQQAIQPNISENENVLQKPTSLTNDAEHKLERIPVSNMGQQESKEKEYSKMTKNFSCRDRVGILLDKTPVKSNKSDVLRPCDSDSSLQSDCDESEDGSIYTSSYQSSIQSNTPRSRRVEEWLDPNAPNTISWPTPSMTTNIRSNDTPERQLPVTKYNEKPKTMGTGQYLTLQKQVRSKSKPQQKADWRSHQYVHRNKLSPTSLPSLLGSASINEVSDLESPNIINLPLNFKFSDEESTIHSQSVYEPCEGNSITGNEIRLRLASPQSLMTVVTQTQETSKIHGITASPQSLMTIATPTVGYPTDEERSNKSKSPKYFSNLNQPRSGAVKFSIPTKKGSNSPHSTSTNESSQDDVMDEKLFGYSKHLRRCITFGMVVALIGSITVLVIAFRSPSPKDLQTNGDDEWKIDIWPATFSPTTEIDLQTKTTSPTLVPTTFSTFEPTTAIELPPSQSPVNTVSPSASSQTRSPNALLRPTTSKVPVQPTIQPTSNPMSIPTFSGEEIKDLTWHRIINGENIWRNSEQTPVWFHAADGTSGITLKVINASKGGRFSEKLQISVEDYSTSKAVSSLEVVTVPYEILCAPPEIGEIKVCSGDYGESDWIGSTILFMREEYIVSALIRINESSSSPASDPLLQYELCHQLGHSLGVVHNDADLGVASCMKDFGEGVIASDETILANPKLQHPNTDDLDYLVKLYGSTSSRMLRRGGK